MDYTYKESVLKEVSIVFVIHSLKIQYFALLMAEMFRPVWCIYIYSQTLPNGDFDSNITIRNMS